MAGEHLPRVPRGNRRVPGASLRVTATRTADATDRAALVSAAQDRAWCPTSDHFGARDAAISSIRSQTAAAGSLNVATLVKVPKPKTRPTTPLDVDQARTFLIAADTHRLAALFSVALACGLRLGEATGLKWDDVDLTSGEVRIRQQLQRVGKLLLLQGAEDRKEPAHTRASARVSRQLANASYSAARGTVEGRRRLG
jgi:integrase